MADVKEGQRIHKALCALKWGAGILCASLLIGTAAYSGSMAYLQSREVTSNKFTVGYADGDIIEDFAPHRGPGTKEVSVENTGSVPVYVRVRILPSSNPDKWSFDWNKSDWVNVGGEIGGWWYYKGGTDAGRLMNSGDTTSDLITRADWKGTSDEWNELDADDAQVFVYMECAQAEDAASGTWYSTPQAAFE